MTLKLCGFAVSNYYNKVKMQLLEKGVPFEEVLVWASQDEGHRARSPRGKVPYIEVDGRALAESSVIAEYVEEAYAQNPLLPRDPFERAKVRELVVFLELHVELVARRLYREAFFGGKISDEARAEVEKELPRGLSALVQLARFAPYLAGPTLTLADCAAAQHLPLVTMATKRIYGRDFAEPYPQIAQYVKAMNQRPAAQRIAADRKENAQLYAEKTARK
ncbi:MAG: glutathione S-transferase [Burkholderiales bacterium]